MALAEEKYVAFTTYKKDGTPKSTPVWIVDAGDGKLAFTTEDGSWKVKRLRNNNRIEVQPSDARGNVTDGSSPTAGTAEVVYGSEFDAVMAATRAKYGWQMTAIQAFGKLRGLFSKKDHGESCAIIITLDD